MYLFNDKKKSILKKTIVVNVFWTNTMSCKLNWEWGHCISKRLNEILVVILAIWLCGAEICEFCPYNLIVKIMLTTPRETIDILRMGELRRVNRLFPILFAFHNRFYLIKNTKYKYMYKKNICFCYFHYDFKKKFDSIWISFKKKKRFH